MKQYHLRSCIAKKDNGEKASGIIVWEDGSTYFCSNSYNFKGSSPSDKHGYNYGWSFNLERVLGGRQSDDIISIVFTDQGFNCSGDFYQFLFSKKEISKVAAYLLLKDKTRKDEVDYLNISKDGVITYMPADKIQEVDSYGNYVEKGRQAGKPARVVRKALTEEALKELTDSDFEVFANLYKAAAEATDGFEIISGERIAQIYNKPHLSQENTGTLKGSCMNGRKEDFFDLYSLNPDVCSMLILYDKEKKLKGRALLWNALGGIKVMDRIYAADSVQPVFKQWASKNGYWCKRTQSAGCLRDFEDKGKSIDKILEIPITNLDWRACPYLDTFCYFNKKTNMLTNDERSYERATKDFYGFRDTGGNASGWTASVTTHDGIRVPQNEARQFGGIWYRIQELILDKKSGDYFPKEVMFQSEMSGDMYNKDSLITFEGKRVSSHELIKIGSDKYAHKDRVFLSHLDQRYHDIADKVVINYLGSLFQVSKAEVEAFQKDYTKSVIVEQA